MIRNQIPRLFAIAAICASSAVATAATLTVSTVGSLDPNPNSILINDAVSNSGVNGVTLAAFKPLVAGAFAGNRGGVVTGDPTEGWTNAIVGNGPANPVSATYGAAQSQTLKLWRTNADPGNSVGDGSLFFGIQANTNNGTNVASGTGYIGFQGSASPSLSFDTGLANLGITLLPRGGDRTATLTVGLSGGGTIVSSTESVVAANTNAVFFGFAAPAGQGIVSLSIADGGGFNRYDDMAFVIGIPEPCSIGLAGLGLLGVIAQRRRR